MNNSKQKKRIVGVDFDDVLMDFMGGLIAFRNSRSDQKINREDYFSFNFHEVWGSSEEDAIKLVQAYNSHEDAKKAIPVEGALEGIEKLRHENRLVIITSKSENGRVHIHPWLEKHLPNVFDDIQFTNHYSQDAAARKRTKAEICKELGVDIFIDDALHNAEVVAESGIPVLLLDTPWNQAKSLPPLVTRVFSWQEIVERIG